MKLLTAGLACLLFVQPLVPQEAHFSLTTNVVTVNVTVLDKDGKPIENLTKDDFEIYEDGKLQKLQAVDFQKLQSNVLPPVTVADTLPAARPKGYNPAAEKAATTGLLTKYQDRRLIVLLFDFSSMQPAEQARARDAATRFLNKQMTSSDSVSIMVYGSALRTIQDFTSDRGLANHRHQQIPSGRFE